MKFHPITEAIDSRGDENMAIREFQTDGQVLTIAFVREFFQNALDAILDTTKKVRVRIRLVKLTNAEDKKYIENTYKDASDLLRASGTYPIENHHYLVIEEFNTTGLTGTDKFKPLEEELSESHWSNFSFGMLRQSKEKDSGGRNGVGKIMLNLLSGLRAVFYKTKRSDDDQDWIGGRMEFNKSTELGEGSDRTRYSNWAWLSPYEGDDVNNLSGEEKLSKLYKPTTTQAHLDAMDRIFGIQRDNDEYGTSWIIPSPLEKNTAREDEHELVDLESMISHTIDSFSWAFMSDFLEVDFDGLVINSENIINVLNERFPTKKHMWSFLDDVRSFPPSELLDVNSLWQDMSEDNLINNDITNSDEIKAVSASFNDDQLVGFSFPITLSKFKNPGDPNRRPSVEKVETTMKVFLQTLDPDQTKKEEMFLRKWLIISGEKSIRAGASVMAVTLIDDPALSEFCAYAEITDHSKFNDQKNTLKQRYSDTRKTLSRIRKAARVAFQTLNVTDNKKYEDILADILGVAIASGIKRKTKRKRKRRLVTRNPNPTPRNQKYVELSDDFDPLVLKPGNDSINAEDCPMTVTLNCSTVGLLGGVKDFDMGEKGFLDANFSEQNCSSTIVSNGSLSVEIQDPDFHLEIDGFKSKFHTSVSIKY